MHARGSFIFLQLTSLGRSAIKPVVDALGIPYVSSGDVPYKDNVPRALTKEEIAEYVGYYARATRNAVERAGFDGVEIHVCNGPSVRSSNRS